MEVLMKRIALAVAAVGAAIMLAPAAAHSQGRVAVGTLDCDISGGIGLIFGSQKQVNCLFRPSVPGPVETYHGTISKVGIDIGATAGGQMVWAVYAPTGWGAGALSGGYVGASAEATVAAGLGANVLVGGNNRTVALQPLSVQGQAGLNVAVGVSELQLRPGR
jgi:hypothetical protein